MFDIKNIDFNLIGNALIQHYVTKTTFGEKTNFLCSCGGSFYQYDPIKPSIHFLKKEIGYPRFSRSKRQRKKNIKKWSDSQKHNNYLLTGLINQIINRACFICDKCGIQKGTNQMIGQRLITVQPLLDDVKQIY
jgi:hypothetical protein